MRGDSVLLANAVCMSDIEHAPQTIAVVRGGPSSEHEVSLKTGEAMIDLLVDTFSVTDILITKDGTWTIQGVEVQPEDALADIDVVVNALHGEYGESGDFQAWLEEHNVPFTGSDSTASALAMHKYRSMQRVQEAGLTVPQTVRLQNTETSWTASEIFNQFSPETLVVKPEDLGSSVGVHMVHTPEELDKALRAVFQMTEAVLIQEYITGIEATCGVIDTEDGGEALPVVEIVPPEDQFFDYKAKYSGVSQEIVPARFSEELTHTIQHQAQIAHTTLGLRQYSRSDFVITADNTVYWLEANTLPGLTKQSLFPQELEAAGYSFKEWLVELVKDAYG